MLENVELGEQKQRDDAYKASKKTTGKYVDKYVDHNYHHFFSFFIALQVGTHLLGNTVNV